MALKDWKKSKTDSLWFYKPADNPTPINPTKATLNAVKFGTDYDIYYSNRKIARVNNREEAIKYMRMIMRNN